MGQKTKSSILPTLFVMVALGVAAIVFVPTNILSRDSDRYRTLRMVVTFEPTPRKPAIDVSLIINNSKPDTSKASEFPWERIKLVKRGERVEVLAVQHNPGQLICAIYEDKTRVAFDDNIHGDRPNNVYCMVVA